MKIIIVGGGIAACSTYLFFRQSFAQDAHECEIKVYEKYAPRTKISSTTNNDANEAHDFEELSSSTAIIGGGIGLAPNGCRVLREISENLHDAVVAQGYPCENFIFRSSRGWKLMENPTTDGKGEVCVASSRYGLWKCLSRLVGEGVIEYRKVVKVHGRDGGRRARVVFESGEEEEADLIIGADGVKSVVKDGIFGEGVLGPIYDKLIGVGGFVTDSCSQEALERKAMVFTFGPSGFFGYAPLSKSEYMWWSTIQADDLPSQSRIALSDLRKQLVEHHGDWKDPFIQQVIQKADVEHIYPCWTTPDLPRWSKNGLILVGDAAHALNPTSGQGSSQALEDAKCLSICLSRYLAQVNSQQRADAAIDRAGELYYGVRHPRLHAIAARTAKIAQTKKNLSFVEEMITLAFFWLMGKFPSLGKLLIGDVNKELYEWDVHDEIKERVRKTKLEQTAQGQEGVAGT